VHKFEKAIEDLVEASITSILPAHNDKEIIIFIHTDGIINMVDENIDTFIHIGRHTWDFGLFIFDRYPIYDIDDNSQGKRVELSSSED
jgi:hypothetical protein